MNIPLSQAETIARAMSDLRIGLPIIISADDTSLTILSAESANNERIAQAMQLSGAQLVLTARRASILKARIYDHDIARITIPAGMNADWVRSIADPTTDLKYPMKGPLNSIREGPANLSRIAVTLLRKARLLPVALTWPVKTDDTDAYSNNLTQVDSEALSSSYIEPMLQNAASAKLPLQNWPDAQLKVFRVADGSEDHCAVIFGNPSPDDAVFTRLHSACLTGDALGSLKCDCGQQLQAAMDYFQKSEGGILLYLNQEGRGIGLVNKIRAYGLQDQGYDTVEANHRLGFEDDERNFGIGAALLRQLGFSKVRLLTNNPAKVRLLEENGISVKERIPLIVDLNKFNKSYLAVKAAKSGHLL